MKKRIFVNGICEERMNFKENSIYCDELKESIAENIEKILLNDENVCFITAMRQGADIYTALEVLALKKRYPKAELHCILPFEDQADKLLETERDRYFAIIEQCDRLAFFQKKYTDGCVEECIDAAKKACDAELCIDIGEDCNINITCK